jgi:hypothetical protein
MQLRSLRLSLAEQDAAFCSVLGQTLHAISASCEKEFLMDALDVIASSGYLARDENLCLI